MWCRLNDERPKVGRSEQPALIDLFTNEGPSFYRVGRRRECQRPIAKASRLRSSACLRCSDAQPEEKFVHRRYWQIGLGPCAKQCVAGLSLQRESYPSRPKI